MSVARAAIAGARGVDSYPFSQVGSDAQAKALKAAGIDFVALYLGVAKQAQNDACLAAGLATFGVTVANTSDGTRSAVQAKAMGLAAGTSLFYDLEGPIAYQTPPKELIAAINAWADKVQAAGYVPGLYVGSPQPLTSDELWKLHVTRYWRAPARVVDRNGAFAEPECGWCMFQANPSTHWGGVYVDVDFVSQDYKGRTPMMCSAF